MNAGSLDSRPNVRLSAGAIARVATGIFAPAVTSRKGVDEESDGVQPSS